MGLNLAGRRILKEELQEAIDLLTKSKEIVSSYLDGLKSEYDSLSDRQKYDEVGENLEEDIENVEYCLDSIVEALGVEDN